MHRSIAVAIAVIAACLHCPCTTAWLSGDWLGTNPAFRTRVRPELEWRRAMNVGLTDGPGPARGLADAFNVYNFTLPAIQLARGTGYVGSAARLRRAISKLARRAPGTTFKLGAIGGSISWGQGASERGRTDWFSILSQWMITSFPHVNITARNGCTPGVPTPYMIMCLELSLDADVDLVFMEYTLNDAHSLANPLEEGVLFDNRLVRDTERLARRVLALPGKPAVVLLHSMPVGMANYPLQHPKNPNDMPYRPFWQTTEDVQGAIAQYYDVQYLSTRTALYRLAVHKQQEGFLWEDAFVDHHPGDHGHKIMADLAVNLLQRTAIGLLMEPFGPEDRDMVHEPLPPPMYAGNVPPNSTMCSVGDAFRALVILADGFEHVNEGTALKPKPGYVATKPGSRLHIRVDTDRSGVAGGGSGQQVSVYVHHLRSYEHMGRARLSCVSGCTCPDADVDAHITERVSQVFLAQLDTTQSPHCVVQVAVLDGTSSGEHKFKVSGVVVAEAPGAATAVEYIGSGANKPFGLQQHVEADAQVKWASGVGRTGGEGGR